MVDLENLELKYFCNGFDVPYKLQNGGILNIKPILVKDYPYYEYSSSILEIRKNETDNIEIIKMSYLDFLLNIVISKDEHKDKLINLLAGIKMENLVYIYVIKTAKLKR